MTTGKTGDEVRLVLVSGNLIVDAQVLPGGVVQAGVLTIGADIFVEASKPFSEVFEQEFGYAILSCNPATHTYQLLAVVAPPLEKTIFVNKSTSLKC